MGFPSLLKISQLKIGCLGHGDAAFIQMTEGDSRFFDFTVHQASRDGTIIRQEMKPIASPSHAFEKRREIKAQQHSAHVFCPADLVIRNVPGGNMPGMDVNLICEKSPRTRMA